MTSTARAGIGMIAIVALALAGALLISHGVYGFVVFLLLPSVLGGLTAWVFQASTAARAAGIGALANVFALGLFLAVGQEGLGCLALAAPLAVPLGAVGGLLAFGMRTPALTGSMFMLLPLGLAWDVNVPPPVFEVRSEIEVAASPDQVWRQVVSFPDLPEPREWFFRAGIAYPVRARIEGTGVGATRYCEFSTGPFVEPIETWNAPRLLRFNVSQSPEPMREWSPFPIHPRHLHGYLVSKRGQFRLTPLGNHHTLLEGTTWYSHGLWPAQYWRWWSDAIIHRIHMRVLNHIRTLAEADAQATR